LRPSSVVGGCLAAALLVCAPTALADDAPVTPAGWRVAPAGQEIGVSKAATGFQGPQNSALSPDGRMLLAASSGASKYQSADLFDLQAGTRTDTELYDAAAGRSVFYGVVFSPDGKRAWTSGGGENVVHSFTVDGDQLTPAPDIPGVTWAAGMAYGTTPNGPRIYVANNLAGAPAAGQNPPGGTVTVIDPNANGGNGAVIKTIDLGSRLQPLGVTFDRSGSHAFVTNWMGRSVSVIDTATEQKVADVPLSPVSDPLVADHPSAVTANPKRDEVYTANANSDTVSVIDTTTNAVLDTIDVSLVAGRQKGANPIGLDVAPDGRTLYVALAGENAIAVVDLDQRRVIGHVPTAWYPSDVDVTPDGKRLVVTNTNDSGAGPNPCGSLQPAQPLAQCTGQSAPPPESQYSGRMIKGSIQVVDVPQDPGELQAGTELVERNNQVKGRLAPQPKGASEIKHVIYVLKENRTYDQVFGDLPGGNGDPRLVLFDDRSAPNHRELARRFSLIDNFYADAEVSADGHNWATQANATDYVDKTWPINYSPSGRSSQRAYDFEDVPIVAQFPTEPLASDPSFPRSAAAQTAGYLWDNAYDHGVSFRDFGEYTSSRCDGTPITSQTTRLNDAKTGQDHVSDTFPGYNTACSDHAYRYPAWQKEFDTIAAKPGDQLPALQFVRFPNDHTRGTVPGAATPEAYMADNDLALGRLVDSVSHSKFWRSTIILVTEDDAQNGPDHVDAHRTVALAISPWTQHPGQVDDTHYDTASMVATAEDLLGLPPMSIVDARVNRMWGSFRSQPDETPYTAIQPEVTPFGAPGAPVNGAAAPMAAQSASWDFTKQDATPEIALNRAIWKSVKGAASQMPAPRHQKIIGSVPNDG
jgi:YVTN family beta-propeller protein